ncbi:MAG: DUF1573 domain-containing protein [Ginsengibacter sp.]
MKIFFTLITALAFCVTAFAQTSIEANNNLKTSATSQPTEQSEPAAEILEFNESEFDFGKIPQGKSVTHVFDFKNNGTTAFSLDNVQASCGCTTPEWDKNIIQPGATSKITVGYNAQNEGSFAKPVTITYNGTQSKQIIIKGEVWTTPVNSAPENTKINDLK